MFRYKRESKNFEITFVLIILTFIFVFIPIQEKALPYFGSYSLYSPNPFVSSRSHIYGTTRIPGLPLGNLMGGLYSSLYGSFGLFGGSIGSLYSGLNYGLYGLYGGLNSGLLNSGLGLYSGMMGLYGAGLGLYGNMFGLSGTSLFGPSGLGILTGTLGFGNTLATIPTVTAEQVGTWTGTWTNFTLSGIMTLNLAEDLLTGALYGYAQLLGNTYLSALISVDGTVLNNQIFVSGSGVGLGNQTFTCEIIGILTTATTMIGTYNMINNSSGGTIVEQGSISLELIPAII